MDRGEIRRITSVHGICRCICGEYMMGRVVVVWVCCVQRVLPLVVRMERGMRRQCMRGDNDVYDVAGEGGDDGCLVPTWSCVVV